MYIFKKNLCKQCFWPSLMEYVLCLKQNRSAPKLLYSINFFVAFLKCTVWVVVGHKHQCAFFFLVYFFDQVLEGKGVISPPFTVEKNKKTSVLNLHKIEPKRGMEEVWSERPDIWLFSFLWRGLKTQYSHAYHFFFSQMLDLLGNGEGTHQNQVAIYLETYFINKKKNMVELSFIYI